MSARRRVGYPLGAGGISVDRSTLRADIFQRGFLLSVIPTCKRLVRLHSPVALMTDVTKPDSPMPGQLLIDTRSENDRVVLSLRGELDLTSVPQFDQELQAAEAANPGRLVIDLSGLDFMDSTGLRALLQARERAKGDRSRARTPPRPTTGSARARAHKDARRLHVRELRPPAGVTAPERNRSRRAL